MMLSENWVGRPLPDNSLTLSLLVAKLTLSKSQHELIQHIQSEVYPATVKEITDRATFERQLETPEGWLDYIQFELRQKK